MMVRQAHHGGLPEPLGGFRRRRLPDRASGEYVDANVRGGLAIVAASAPDEFAAGRAIERLEVEMAEAWATGNMARYRELTAVETGPVVRNGFVLWHAGSSRRLTPTGWLFDQVEDAEACALALLNNEPWGRLFDGALSAIERLGSWVVGVHREHGCFTGKFDFIRRLDGSVRSSAHAEQLVALRASPACEKWRVAQPVQGRAA